MNRLLTVSLIALGTASGTRAQDQIARSRKLVGGVHVIPQTALGGQNGFELLAGGGADYAFNPRLSARVGADYLRTNMFGQSQNNLQGNLDVVVHF